MVFDRISQWNHLSLEFLCVKFPDNKFNFLEIQMSYFTWSPFSLSHVFQEISPISSNLSNIWEQICLQYPLLSHTCRRVYSDGPFCVPNIAIYIFPSFFLISLFRGIQFYLCFQITNFWLFFCLFSTSMSSAPLIASLMLTLDLICLSFSSFLMHKFRIFILNFSFFILYNSLKL